MKYYLYAYELTGDNAPYYIGMYGVWALPRVKSWASKEIYMPKVTPFNSREKAQRALYRYIRLYNENKPFTSYRWATKSRVITETELVALML
jgi:hypothetical protein